MVDHRLALMAEVLVQLREHFGLQLLGSAVGTNVAWRRPSHGRGAAGKDEIAVRPQDRRSLVR